MSSTTQATRKKSTTGWVWADRAFTWMERHQLVILAVGLGIQLLVLLTMVVQPAKTFVTGKTILLQVVPVDPRDLFRGDYVILNYEFSRVRSEEVVGLPGRPTGSAREWQGRTVYVTLTKEADGPHWQADQFSLEKPPGGTFLRGRFTSWGSIEFGIESFFVQEGRGYAYEQAARTGKLSAEIAVDPNGTAVLKQLVIDDR